MYSKCLQLSLNNIYYFFVLPALIFSSFLKKKTFFALLLQAFSYWQLLRFFFVCQLCLLIRLLPIQFESMYPKLINLDCLGRFCSVLVLLLDEQFFWIQVAKSWTIHFLVPSARQFCNMYPYLCSREQCSAFFQVS